MYKRALSQLSSSPVGNSGLRIPCICVSGLSGTSESSLPGQQSKKQKAKQDMDDSRTGSRDCPCQLWSPANLRDKVGYGGQCTNFEKAPKFSTQTLQSPPTSTSTPHMSRLPHLPLAAFLLPPGPFSLHFDFPMQICSYP